MVSQMTQGNELTIPSLQLPSPPLTFSPEELDWWEAVQAQLEWYIRNLARTALAMPQSYISNGGFGAWSGGNPVSWTILGSPAVTQLTNGVRLTATAINDGIEQVITGLEGNRFYAVSFVSAVIPNGGPMDTWPPVTVQLVTNGGRTTSVTPYSSGVMRCPSAAFGNQAFGIDLGAAEVSITFRVTLANVGDQIDLYAVQMTRSPWSPEWRGNVADATSVIGDFSVGGKLTVVGRLDPTTVEISAPDATRPAGIGTGGIWRKSTDGRNYVYNGATDLKVLLDGEGGSPGGASTQIQFNDAGVFAGDTLLTWDKVLKILATRFLDVTYTQAGDVSAAIFNQARNSDAVVIQKTGVGAGAGLRVANAGTGKSVEADTIGEVTSGGGVTVDGCLLKDGRVDAQRIPIPAFPGTAIAFGTTRYLCVSGSCILESSAQMRMPGGITKRLSFVIEANTCDGTFVVTLRKNAVNTAITLTVGAGTTGLFTTTGSVEYAAGDLLSISAIAGGTAGTVTLRSGTFDILP